MAQRALIVVLGVLVAALLAFQLMRCGPHASWLPGCMLHRLTGLHCPGCGMTRAAHATLGGDLAAAFRFNPLGMVLLPLAIVGIGFELAAWVRGKPLGFTPRIGGRWAWVVVFLIIGFWILRNIPAWPCTLLAPP
jgi:Protein of unknown function (DUF2752)